MTVKFKFGTWAKYSAIATPDPDTLYFITDRGTFFKGSQPYVGIKSAVVTSSGVNEDNICILTLTDSLNTNISFSVPSSTALSALKTALETELSNHANSASNSTVSAHVKLSDSINSTANAATGKTAATPKAVKDALDAAKSYADGILGANDAMVFKGTIGTGGTVTALPTSNYSAGWTYRVITAATHAGVACEVGDLIIAVKDYSTSASQSDWTVAQANIDGAVTVTDILSDSQLVVGNGNRVVKTLPAGANGKVLKIVSGVPAWADSVDVDEKITTADAGTAKMFIAGVSSATGNQTGKTKTTLYFTSDTLYAPKISGNGANLTNISANNITGIMPISKGGTGATTASAARTNLGLGDAAIKGVASSIALGGSDLPTSGVVYDAIQDIVTNSLTWEEI